MLLLKLSIRNILRQKRRSFLTGISMSLGLVLAAVSLGIVEGSYGKIVDTFTRERTGHVQVHAADYLERPSLYKQIRNVDDIIAKIEAVPGVVSATPRILAPSLAFASSTGSSGDKTAPASLIGIDPVLEARTTTIAQKPREGDFLTGALSADGYDVVMVGRALAKTLRLEPGADLVLIGQGVDGSIANDIYRVGAIIGTKDGVERQNVYMSLEAARRYLSMGPAAHQIALISSSPDRARDIAAAVTHALDDDGLTVLPWQKVETMFHNAMKADQQSNKVTSAIIMAMVAIGVLNAVLMNVLERTREYGLLRAIGTRPRIVFTMIVCETMMLGVMAAFVGVALALPALDYLADPGIPLATPIDMGGMSFDAIVAQTSVKILAYPVALVLVTALLVSLWPAARSARVTPVEALGSA